MVAVRKKTPRERKPSINLIRKGVKEEFLGFAYEGDTRKEFIKAVDAMDDKTLMQFDHESSYIQSLYDLVDLEPPLKKLYKEYVGKRKKPELTKEVMSDKSRKKREEAEKREELIDNIGAYFGSRWTDVEPDDMQRIKESVETMETGELEEFAEDLASLCRLEEVAVTKKEKNALTTLEQAIINKRM
ncbi:MAG: hypothetical protein C4576_03285 [Desulfobacteraceae bacterium]|nr:MAG: hypothetical protein C4576_03285 [Desulfobacteraceae bacterium]